MNPAELLYLTKRSGGGKFRLGINTVNFLYGANRGMVSMRVRNQLLQEEFYAGQENLQYTEAKRSRPS